MVVTLFRKGDESVHQLKGYHTTQLSGKVYSALLGRRPMVKRRLKRNEAVFILVVERSV